MAGSASILVARSATGNRHINRARWLHGFPGLNRASHTVLVNPYQTLDSESPIHYIVLGSPHNRQKNTMDSLILAGAFSSREKAAEVASRTQGINLSATAGETGHLPFASLVLSVTDDLSLFVRDADVGSYLICARTIKNTPLLKLKKETQPGSIGIFTMVANADLGALESDQHWRDRHAPLALEVHTAMTHYYQLSVLHQFNGPLWNGFALCCFNNEDDLRNRFFNTPEGEAAIARDVALFADPRKSPRRVIATIAG